LQELPRGFPEKEVHPQVDSDFYPNSHLVRKKNVFSKLLRYHDMSALHTLLGLYSLCVRAFYPPGAYLYFASIELFFHPFLFCIMIPQSAFLPTPWPLGMS
jgi:hypothetical protein